MTVILEVELKDTELSEHEVADKLHYVLNSSNNTFLSFIALLCSATRSRTWEIKSLRID